MPEQMAFSIDLRDWRRILAPCPVAPMPTITYVFNVISLSEPKTKVVEVLKKYDIPHVFFPNDDNILTCRMRFIFFPEDGSLLFELDPREDKGLETIEFAIKLLKEMGFINDENEQKVREKMKKDWNSWIKVWGPLLPIFLGILMKNNE